MDTTTSQNERNPPSIEMTSHGVPNTLDLFEDGYAWCIGLKNDGLAKNGRLRTEGKEFFHGWRRQGWITELPEGEIEPHRDFNLALSVADMKTIGHPDQPTFNRLCGDISMLYLAAGNHIITEGADAKTRREEARKDLRTTYKNWSRHLNPTNPNRNNSDPVKSELWMHEYSVNTKALAQATDRLSRLVPIDTRFKRHSEEQTSLAPTTTQDFESYSPLNEHDRSDSSLPLGSIEDLRGHGGLFVPSAEGGLGRNADYGEDEEGTGGGSGGRSRITSPFKAAFKKIKK